MVLSLALLAIPVGLLALWAPTTLFSILAGGAGAGAGAAGACGCMGCMGCMGDVCGAPYPICCAGAPPYAPICAAGGAYCAGGAAWYACSPP